MTTENKITIFRCAYPHCEDPKPFTIDWDPNHEKADYSRFICNKCYEKLSAPSPYDTWDGNEVPIGIIN